MMRFFGSMRRVIALLTVGVCLAAYAAPAEARYRYWRGGNRGGAVAAAAIGGLAVGALIAGASRPAYGYGYGYAAPAYDNYGYAAPAYYAPAATYYQPAYATPVYRPYRPRHRPVYRRYVSSEPICTIQRKRVWLNRNTYTFRRVTTCH